MDNIHPISRAAASASLLLLFAFALAMSGCASAPQADTPLPQCPEGEFSGLGVGDGENEARNAAYSELAKQINSSIKVISEYTVSQQASNGNENIASQYGSKTFMEADLSNAHDIRIIGKKQGGGKTSIVACMSKANAAKGFVEKIRPIADSLKFAASGVIDQKHPRLKSEAWQKAKPLWNRFVGLYYSIEGLDKEQSAPFEPVKALYAKAGDIYLDFCQTAKLYWNPEQNDVYSEIAFSKLSKNLKMEKAACKGLGISIIYKNTGHKCEFASIFQCSHKPSLLIASCYGEEYRLLENEDVETYQKVEEIALEKLREKLRYENFWNDWEQEIKQWRPLCE